MGVHRTCGGVANLTKSRNIPTRNTLLPCLVNRHGAFTVVGVAGTARGRSRVSVAFSDGTEAVAHYYILPAFTGHVYAARAPFKLTPMAVNSISSGPPHVRPMCALHTCGEPDGIQKNTHPNSITALGGAQGVGGQALVAGRVANQGVHKPLRPAQEAVTCCGWGCFYEGVCELLG